MPTYYPPRRTKDIALAKMARQMANDPDWAAIRTSATQIVPGHGYLDAKVALVGEAPGAEEDLAGRPFVGEAGRVLDDLLRAAGLRRSDVWITNLVKYRPPGNRDPFFLEARTGKKWLRRELSIVRPVLAVLMGKHALQAVHPRGSITREHGILFATEERGYLPVYHPAATLYDPSKLSVVTGDFEKIPSILTYLERSAEFDAALP